MRHILLLLLCISTFIGCFSKVETINAELISEKPQFTNENQERYIQKAFAYYDNAQYDSVLVYCHKSYAVNSQNWELFYLYGKTSFKTGHFKLADEQLNKSLTLCNNDKKNRAKIYFALAENENSLENYNRAKKHYLMVIQLNSGSELTDIAFKKLRLLSLAE